MNIRKIVGFLIIFTQFAGVIKSQTNISETPESYYFKGKNFSALINKSPFQIVLGNYKNDVIKIKGIVWDGKSTGSNEKVISCESGQDKIGLIISTDNNYYSVKITFKENGLKISLFPSDNTIKDKIGLRFDTKTSGHWYGGAVVKAHLWPLEGNSFIVDPFYGTSNQASPVWYTSSGAGIFSETYSTMGYSFNKPENGVFELYSKIADEFQVYIAISKNIRDAYFELVEIVGKPSVTPPYDYFAYPQFNTWIEFQSKVNQEGIQKYVQEIRKNNFPSRLFIIDDKWTMTYGDTEFDRKKFPEPEKMISFLHENNFKVVLWITPFIERAATNYQYAADRHYLIMDSANSSPYLAEWWNGTAALVDLSNPDAYSWYLGMLTDLKEKYGVDGFKLDAGDAQYLDKPFASHGSITPSFYTDLFAGIGKYFEANELRVSWLAQKMGLIERLRDKAPSWSDVDGINSLIPHALTVSLLGYSYVCPDMIGGGLDSGFEDKNYKFDEELFVRWTEASALMPMMQYSLAPWKLKQENISICRKYSDLHVSLGNYIYKLAEQSRVDGTPIVRPVFFEFPDDEKAFQINDQFMLGERFLVAPVLQKGATSRKIYLPESSWIDFWTGNVIKGGQTIDYPAPLDVLPIFVKVGKIVTDSITYQNYIEMNKSSEYEVSKLTGSMKIDGDWLKPEWEKIKSVSITNYMGKVPGFKPDVQAKMMYDDNNLYIIFMVEDCFVRCRTDKINGPVWEDSCVEFFFSPDKDFPLKYFNLEVNCGGTPLMHYNTIPRKEHIEIDTRDIKKIQVAHSLPRLIDPEISTPVKWTVEYKIPFKMIEKYSNVTHPGPGVTWRGNFYKIAENNSNPHYITWSVVANIVPDFHIPEFFGVLKFK